MHIDIEFIHGKKMRYPAVSVEIGKRELFTMIKSVSREIGGIIGAEMSSS